MQCKCGGSTKTHTKVKNKKVVSQYYRCTSCGRVDWLYKENTKC